MHSSDADLLADPVVDAVEAASLIIRNERHFRRVAGEGISVARGSDCYRICDISARISRIKLEFWTHSREFTIKVQ